ncbi:MAG TPA: DNA-binding protein [Polyangiaceae bacterium]|nr:DNA-binding protein [Polyangiaceae bacterium]
MSTVNDQIRERVEAFAEELTELIRAAAMETVASALGEGAVGGGRGRGRGRRAAAAVAVRVGRRGARAASREKGAKRPPQEIEKLTAKLGDYVKSNPGQRIEQIAKGMGTSTKELNLPVKKLIATKAIKTRGQKRATQYFPR